MTQYVGGTGALERAIAVALECAMSTRTYAATTRLLDITTSGAPSCVDIDDEWESELMSRLRLPVRDACRLSCDQPLTLVLGDLAGHG